MVRWKKIYSLFYLRRKRWEIDVNQDQDWLRCVSCELKDLLGHPIVKIYIDRLSSGILSYTIDKTYNELI